MGEDSAAIRQQIEETRDRMSGTVDALGYKADVPARAKDRVNDRVETIKSKFTGVSDTISDRTPDSGEMKDGARQAAGVAQENPLGLLIGAAAVGFLAGMMIPSTQIEDQRIGAAADQVKDQVRATGQEAIEHGKQIAQDTAQVAGDKAQEAVGEIKDAAQDSAQQHGEELSDSARESADQLKDAAPGGD